jgi:DNA-directed RNA polymerase subunit beta'
MKRRQSQLPTDETETTISADEASANLAELLNAGFGGLKD